MKTYKQLKESLSHDYVLQHLADKDINAHIKNGKVVVHPDDAAETRRHLKKIGHDHLRVTIKGADQVAESVEELDEIKLATVGKIIKHSPKIASAAIGAAVAAHSVDVPKQPVKASYSEFTKKIQKEEVELEEAKDTITKDASGKVTSWKHEGDWTKSNNKNAEGKVHNLVGQALKKTKELTKEEVELTEGKIPVEHAANSVGKVLGQHNAVKFLAHLKPGTEKHTSWDKINTALKSQGVQTHHIAKIAGHIKPVEFKEEVESLNELSKKTLGSYIKKASKDRGRAGLEAMGLAWHYPHKTKEQHAEINKMVKRQKGVERATDKLTKEEVESLDELSKKTLGSYVKQASDSAAALATTAMHQRHQSDAHYANGDKKKSAEFGKYSFDSTERQLKRQKGIKKAVDKLTKEEVESLDELSKKTLGSYVKKATGGLNGVAHHAFNANEKIGRDSDDRAKSYSKAVKRIKGVEQATDKLTKEEVESLDEGSFKYHMDKAVAADARGDTKNKEYHLSHAKTARYAVPTAAYPKHKELFDKYKKMTEEVELDEVLDPSMGAGEYVKDFQKSDAPQFKGKSQEKRRIMGIAAYMAAKREQNK